jgi:hypothetical protein
VFLLLLVVGVCAMWLLAEVLGYSRSGGIEAVWEAALSAEVERFGLGGARLLCRVANEDVDFTACAL